MPEAAALAAHLAKQPTATIAMLKSMLDGAATRTLDQQLDVERGRAEPAGQGPDFHEGVAAFMEKRAAVFTGR